VSVVVVVASGGVGEEREGVRREWKDLLSAGGFWVGERGKALRGGGLSPRRRGDVSACRSEEGESGCGRVEEEEEEEEGEGEGRIFDRGGDEEMEGRLLWLIERELGGVSVVPSVRCLARV
jgi:hypothetical protein